MGSLQDPEDPLHSSHNKCRCQGSVSVSATFQHGNGMTLEILWPYRTQCSWWRPSPCSCCCDSQASIRLETTSRKTQLHVAQSHWIGSETTEHRSFLHVEEGSLSRTLAFDCGHAQEEYATKRSERMCLRYKFMMNLTNVVLHNTFLMVCDVFGRATRAFQNLLYLYPDFKCCNEVHVRLGLMFKAASEHESSLKVITHTHTHTHTFNGPFSWTARVGRYQKGKTYLDFTEARDSERQGSDISWAICKSAPCSRQITTPAPHHSVFCGPDALHAAQPTVSKHWRPKVISMLQ